MPRTGRMWAVNIALMFVAFLFWFLILEGVLRFAGVQYPLFLAVDAYTGFNLVPYSSGWHRTEGVSYVRINSHGQRDAEHNVVKPDDAYRIAIIGDSFAEARQVDIPETFWSMAQKMLSSCPSLPAETVEVLNFGVSGFGTAQELMQFRSRVAQFEPDMVVLAFTPSNDIMNNSFALAQVRDRPYFLLGSGAALVEDLSFRDTDFYRNQRQPHMRVLLWVLRHSRMAQLLNHTRKVFAVGWATTPTQVPGAEQGIHAHVYREPLDPGWINAWDVTERLILLLQREVQATGAQLLMMTTTSGIQVHPDAAVREVYMRHENIDNLFYPDERIAFFARTHGIPVLLTGPTLRHIAQTENIALHGFENSRLGFGHWNERGHEEVSQLLTAFVCDNLKLLQDE